LQKKGEKKSNTFREVSNLSKRVKEKGEEGERKETNSNRKREKVGEPKKRRGCGMEEERGK